VSMQAPELDTSQTKVLDFLLGSGADEPFITTHISVIARSRYLAWKLKRGVCLPYLDFSTPERRLVACARELELNRRTAPSIYRRVRRITSTAGGGLEFDGRGALVDAVVEMNRFDQDSLLDAVAGRGGLTQPVLTALARTIAGFHAGLPGMPVPSGAAILLNVFRLNHRSLEGISVFSPAMVAKIERELAAALARHADLLDVRAAGGKIRHCHGDLHLRNICLFNGEPVLFDCI
jgi:aminoglycoside phosphotransferase family enzyme